MQKCPRCELLLLDTDAECPRCHASVDPVLSHEQAAEKAKSTEKAFRGERARMDQSDGDYIPPLLPPLAMPTTALLMSISLLSGLFCSRSGLELKLWMFTFILMVAIMGGTVLNTFAVWILLRLTEGKFPRLDRALFSASLTLFIAFPLTFGMSVIPFDFSNMAYFIAWLLCFFIAVKSMFEMSFFQGLIVAGLFAGIQAGIVTAAVIMFGDMIEFLKWTIPFSTGG